MINIIKSVIIYIFIKVINIEQLYGMSGKITINSSDKKLP